MVVFMSESESESESELHLKALNSIVNWQSVIWGGLCMRRGYKNTGINI
jgi:hypothetical protein